MNRLLGGLGCFCELLMFCQMMLIFLQFNDESEGESEKLNGDDASIEWMYALVAFRIFDLATHKCFIFPVDMP